MSSIVRHIDDVISEYGSWDNYLKATEAELVPLQEPEITISKEDTDE